MDQRMGLVGFTRTRNRRRGGLKMKCNSDTANTVLARIETQHGIWTEYGNDGRATTDVVPSNMRQFSHPPPQWRAKFTDNPHSGDYGWGPPGQTEAEAVALFLAEFLGSKEE
jgi:hypothetical protein